METGQRRTALVTGTGGIGFEVARALHSKGWAILLAGRDNERGTAACDRIAAEPGDGRVHFVPLDLANLASVANLANLLKAREQRLDVLVNNAGVTAGPVRQSTSDGFESQIGTNYLGHFALTGQLLPLLTRSSAPRVVSVTSLSSKSGVLDFEDFTMETRYNPIQAYSRSKLALLTFSLELQRRSLEQGWRVLSCAAHPGLSPTGILRGAIPSEGRRGAIQKLYKWIGHPPAAAAGSVVFAASSDEAEGGLQYGPSGLFGTKGKPKSVGVNKHARDLEAARRLWSMSQDLTGSPFP
ncbi:SDR family oxidoreductase [Sphingomonas oligophenolica]|uniref:SDR family NAD(P)-dependent oxidoreductase n=1 Tax=Sphingomonas oligophenolica TaxID=301154 RepID=A0ABU9Y6M8_9SPHN